MQLLGSLLTSAAGSAVSGQGGGPMEYANKATTQAAGTGQQTQQAVQQPPLFQNLTQADALQGPTRSGVPLSTATQANMLGSNQDYNARDPGLFGNLLNAAMNSKGPVLGQMPQVDASFMNQPMVSPQQNSMMQQSVDPQSLLLAMLQRQIG